MQPMTAKPYSEEELRGMRALREQSLYAIDDPIVRCLATIEKRDLAATKDAHMGQEHLRTANAGLRSYNMTLSTQNGEQSARIADLESTVEAQAETIAQLRERGRESADKAIRFDLDQLGIEARERESVELFQLRADLAAAIADRDKLRDLLGDAERRASDAVIECMEHRVEAETARKAAVARAEKAEAHVKEAEADCARYARQVLDEIGRREKAEKERRLAGQYIDDAHSVQDRLRQQRADAIADAAKLRAKLVALLTALDDAREEAGLGLGYYAKTMPAVGEAIHAAHNLLTGTDHLPDAGEAGK